METALLTIGAVLVLLLVGVTVAIAVFSARWQRVATRDNVKGLVSETQRELLNSFESRMTSLEASFEDFVDKARRIEGRVHREKQTLERQQDQLAQLEAQSQGIALDGSFRGADQFQTAHDRDQERLRVLRSARRSG